MQEDDVASQGPVAGHREQAGHRLTAIDRIEEKPFEPSQQPDGFEAVETRNAIPTSETTVIYLDVNVFRLVSNVAIWQTRYVYISALSYWKAWDVVWYSRDIWEKDALS